MSGGSFNYSYRKVDEFSYTLEKILDDIDRDDEDCGFEKETIEKLEGILVLCRKTAKLMKEVEWLISGDTGDESFMKRVKEIENG